ncbi:MAG: hypothetical protein IT280_00075 [Ignavibacteria bacterium]|nr:hypothetical protein [Ignavibacteria bacterium]
MKPPKEPNLNFCPQHYLQLEAKKFEIVLKLFFETGIINQVDYRFLTVTLEMIITFLNTRIPVQPQEQSKRKNYWDQPNYLRKHSKQRKLSAINNLRQLSLFDLTNPLPITGKIEVTGLNERLDAIKLKESIPTEPKFPHKIPSGTHWKQVIINFLNNEQIEINVKKLRHITDYKEMGFVGKGKIPEPSEQWIFLKVLAQCNGELTIKDDTAKDTYKQQKHLLTESLQNYFSIDFDPFYPYKSSPEKHGNSYRIKLTLIPPPKQYNEPHTETAEEDTLGIREFLDEHAPQVIES